MPNEEERYIYVPDPELTPEQLQQLKIKWEEQFKGLTNAGHYQPCSYQDCARVYLEENLEDLKN